MNFFTSLDTFVYFLIYPLTFLGSVINSFYTIYVQAYTNVLTLFIIYTMESNCQNPLVTYILFLFDLHLNFDFYVTEPVVYTLSYYYIMYFFNIIVNSVTYLIQFGFTTTVYSSAVISLKFIVLIALLVFVRGGIPRYRFDYLTKLGWTKFLSLILLSFLLELYLIWIF